MKNKKEKFDESCEIASVYDAVGTYAYFINKVAEYFAKS